MQGVIAIFGSSSMNERDYRVTEFCKEKYMIIANTLFNNHSRRKYTWKLPGYGARLITYFIHQYVKLINITHTDYQYIQN